MVHLKALEPPPMPFSQLLFIKNGYRWKNMGMYVIDGLSISEVDPDLE
jgi:hypothetical protein